MSPSCFRVRNVPEKEVIPDTGYRKEEGLLQRICLESLIRNVSFVASCLGEKRAEKEAMPGDTGYRKEEGLLQRICLRNSIRIKNDLAGWVTLQG